MQLNRGMNIMKTKTHICRTPAWHNRNYSWAVTNITALNNFSLLPYMGSQPIRDKQNHQSGMWRLQEALLPLVPGMCLTEVLDARWRTTQCFPAWVSAFLGPTGLAAALDYISALSPQQIALNAILGLSSISLASWHCSPKVADSFTLDCPERY